MLIKKTNLFFSFLLLILLIFSFSFYSQMVYADLQNSEEILHFQEEEICSSFKVSPDEKLFAYYSLESQLLKVIDLGKNNVIWQCSISRPVYSWIPNSKTNILSYIKEDDKQISLVNLDFASFLDTTMFQISGENTFIENIWWSPQGNHLAFLTIRGLEDAHGYSQLKIITKEGKYLKPNIDDVYNIIWSEDEKYLAVKIFTKEDFSQSKVELINLKTGEISTFLSAEKQFVPSFSQDGIS